MSEEVLLAAADLELIERLRAQLQIAQADAAALREALEYRHTCENCGGKGGSYVDVNGEAESEVCDCWIHADHVLYHEEHDAGAQLLTALQAARHALLSYAHGNSAPALAEEMVAQIEKVIGI